jgi:hypothetical protein
MRKKPWPVVQHNQPTTGRAGNQTQKPQFWSNPASQLFKPAGDAENGLLNVSQTNPLMSSKSGLNARIRLIVFEEHLNGIIDLMQQNSVV